VSDSPDSTGDSLIPRAATLVAAARIAASGLYIPMVEKAPWIREIDPRNWNFFLTVSFVFVAVTKLNDVQPPEDRLDKVLEVVSADLDAWHRDARGAFEDCKTFFDRTWDMMENDAVYSKKQRSLRSGDAIGMWLCWSLLRRPPHEQYERELAGQLGVMAVNEFTRWWDA